MTTSYELNVTEMFDYVTPDIPPFFPPFNRTPEELCVPGKELKRIEIPSNIFENTTCIFERRHYPAWEKALKVTFYLVAIVMAVFGNVLVLLVIVFNRRTHTKTYFYIGNLAFSDLIIGAFNMWVHLGTNISADWPFSALLCKLFPFFQVMALTASTGCMTVIAGERFFATVYPMKAKFCRLNYHLIVVSVVWITAIAVAIPMIQVRDLAVLIWADRDQKWCEEVWPRYIAGIQTNPKSGLLCAYDYPERRAYYTIQVVVMYFVPVAVTSATYCVIALTLRHRQKAWRQTDQVLVQQQRTKRRVMRILFVVFAVFVVCWTPQEVIVLMDAHDPSKSQKIPEAVRYVAIYVAYFNSSLNPILYAGLSDNALTTDRDGDIVQVRSSSSSMYKKPKSLVEKGQPRLPSITEHQNEGHKQDEDDTSATSTRSDVTEKTSS